MKYRSVFRSSSFVGAVVLVTGGGTGIGRTIAHELSSLGATVVIAGRSTSSLSRVKEESKGAIAYVVLDIRDTAQCYAVAEDIVKKYGKLTHLVNNAGGQFMAPAADISAKG